MAVEMSRWTTTGEFLAKGHIAGPEGGLRIGFKHRHFCEGLVVEGRPGASKTIGSINPIIEAYARGGGSLFIICIKKDAAREAVALCKRAGRGNDVVVIGQDRNFFITGGLSPATIADLAGQFKRLAIPDAQGGDSFFESNAYARCESAAKLLYGIYGDVPGDELRHFITGTQTHRDGVMEAAEVLAQSFDGCGDPAKQERADAIFEAIDFERGEFAGWRESPKTLQGIVGGLTPFLGLFNDRKFARTFCDRAAGATLDDLYKGKIIIVALDVERNKRAAKGAALLMLAQFESFMKRAQGFAKDDPRRNVEIGCVLDEWGDIANAAQADFLRLARSARIGYAFAVQSDAELGRVLGSKESADALLGLFGSRVCFSTLDATTMESFRSILGKTDQTHLTAADVKGTSSGQNTGNAYNYGGGSGGSNSQGSSTGTTASRTVTKTTREADVCNQQTFHGLERRDAPGPDGKMRPQFAQAVAILNLNGKPVHDIIWCEAVFAD